MQFFEHFRKFLKDKIRQKIVNNLYSYSIETYVRDCALIPILYFANNEYSIGFTFLNHLENLALEVQQEFTVKIEELLIEPLYIVAEYGIHYGKNKIPIDFYNRAIELFDKSIYQAIMLKVKSYAVDNNCSEKILKFASDILLNCNNFGYQTDQRLINVKIVHHIFEINYLLGCIHLENGHNTEALQYFNEVLNYIKFPTEVTNSQMSITSYNTEKNSLNGYCVIINNLSIDNSSIDVLQDTFHRMNYKTEIMNNL
jgi:tetratricopeptide (TPR) repeat protein